MATIRLRGGYNEMKKTFLLLVYLLVFSIPACNPAYGVPIAGDYLYMLKTDDNPVDVTEYVTVKTNASGVPLFRTTAGAEYAVNPSGPNVVTVGTLGDSTTIAGAITIATARTPASTNTITILVGDGIYAEQGLEIPDNVSLVGINREKCIISIASTNYDSLDSRTSALVAAPGNSLIANLTINNTRTAYPSVAIATGWGWTAGTTSGKTIVLRDLTLASNANDTVYMSGNNTITLEDSSAVCAGVDTLSIFTSASGTYTIRNCQFTTQGARGNAIYFASTGILYSYNNEYWCASASDTGALWFVTESNGTIYSIGDTFYDGATKDSLGDIINGVGSGTGWNLYVRNANAADLNDPQSAALTVDADEQSFGNFDIANDLDVDGTANVEGNLTAGASDAFTVAPPLYTIGATGSPAMRWDANNYKLELDDGGGGWLIDIYGDENNDTLFTNVDFSATSLKTNDVERIDGSGIMPTANVTMDADPTGDLGIATRQYVDRAVSAGTLEYYFSNDAADVGGYKYAYDTPPAAPTTITAAGLGDGESVIEEFITESGEPNITALSTGIYAVHIHARKTAGTKSVTLKCAGYKRVLAGTETLLGTTEVTVPLDVSVTGYDIHVPITEEVPLLTTDRIVAKIIATVAGVGTAPTVELSVGSTFYSGWLMPVTGSQYVNVNGDVMKGGLTINSLLNNQDTIIYGTGATALVYVDASKGVGFGTAFPATGFIATANGDVRVSGMVDVNGDAGNPPVWATVPDGGIPNIFEADSNTTDTTVTPFYIRGKFPYHAVGNRFPFIVGQFDNGSQTTGIYGWTEISSVSPFETIGCLQNRQNGSLTSFLEWDENGTVTTENTQWKDFSAVGNAQGEISNPTVGLTWEYNANIGATHLLTVTDATIRKRDESGATTAWTTVGAQQSPSTSASVTVTTYDLADETMDANTSYIIEVESEVTSTGVNLYSVGTETNQRAL
jgi:hypothetical protein